MQQGTGCSFDTPSPRQSSGSVHRASVKSKERQQQQSEKFVSPRLVISLVQEGGIGIRKNSKEAIAVGENSIDIDLCDKYSSSMLEHD